jgi:hypothetical protein
MIAFRDAHSFCCMGSAIIRLVMGAGEKQQGGGVAVVG